MTASKQATAPVTDLDVTEFVQGIAYYRQDEIHPAHRYTFDYPVDDAQLLKRARQSLETVAGWARADEVVDQISELVAIITRCMKSAVKNGDRVAITFSGADLMALRPAVLLLDRYDLTKQSDARSAGRGKYRGKR